MAFDGITIAAVTKELKEQLVGGRIYKIAQPEEDELLLTIKTENGRQQRLAISASASLPLIYLTEKNKPSPMTAPGFCMLLRKHLQNGRITDITQPGLERIVHIHIDHLDEMGDMRHKKLIIEVMGKHSNLIFTDEQDRIIDSIKHISGMVSSIREVLPGRPYFIPQTQEKLNPLSLERETFTSAMLSGKTAVYKALYNHYTGISPLLAQELCYRCGIDGDSSTALFQETEDGVIALNRLYDQFFQLMQQIRSGAFAPAIVYENHAPAEYAAIPLTMYGQESTVPYDSISALLEQYYAEKSIVTRIRQKSVDLRKIVQTALERNIKKYDLQIRQMQDTEKKEQYRIYGELLNTYGYQSPLGASCLEAENYYTGEMVSIPLDPQLSASDNAKRYFDKYNKLKRTYEALSALTVSVKEEIDHLESIQTSLDIAQQEADLAQIREELMQSGYIRRKGNAKKGKLSSNPLHYLSRDGFHIYVGKNNFQNEELTFQFAGGGDWWFHAKGIPGSHVIVKTEGEELPDSTFEDAARLAAYYSKARGSHKAEVDYVQRKHVKKPNGSKPGFVVYYTNYSMAIDTDISRLQLLTD